MNLPPEDEEDFSSEDEVGDTGCSDHQGIEPCGPVSIDTPRAQAPITTTATSASSLADYTNDEPEWRMYRGNIKSVYRYKLSIALYTVRWGKCLVNTTPPYRKGNGFSHISPGRPRKPHWCPRRDIPQNSGFRPHN